MKRFMSVLKATKPGRQLKYERKNGKNATTLSKCKYMLSNIWLARMTYFRKDRVFFD